MLIPAIACSLVPLAPQSAPSSMPPRLRLHPVRPSVLPDQAGLDARGVAAADVDGDGDVDLVISTATGARLWINVGGQGFLDGSAGRLPSGLTGSTLPLLADLDSDGFADLVLVADSFPDPDVVLMGAPGGVFGAPVPLPLGDAVTSDLEIADLNGDGALDIARSVGQSGHGLGTGRDSLLLGSGSGSFIQDAAFLNAAWNTSSVPSTSIASLDANRDRVPDLFITRADLGGASGTPGARNLLLLGTGQGRFIDATAALPDMEDNSFDAVPTDLDGDGDLDLVVANSVIGISGADSADVLVNQGGLQGGRTGRYFDRFGSLDETPPVTQGVRLGFVHGDLDGDGRSDLIVRVHDFPPGSRQEVLRGAGLDFAAPSPIRAGSFVAAGGVCADLDGDGDQDLVLTSSGSAAGAAGLPVRVLLNRTR